MVTAMSVTIAGCTKKTEPPAAAPLDVSVTKVVTQTVPSYFDYVGTTQAIRSVVIRARIEGFLRKRDYVEGSDVEEDVLLYVIEPEPYEKTLAEKTAELAGSKAEAWDARLEATRFENLLAKASTSQSNYDRRRAKSDSTAAQVDYAAAAKDKAAINLSYCFVKSPFAGRISRTQIHVGNLVGDDEATPLTTIVQLDPIYIMFNPPAKHLPTMTAMHNEGKLKVDVFLEDDTDSHYSGRVDFINNEVDPQTSTVLVRAVLQNTKKILLPGQYANVRMYLRPIKDAVFVPEQVILQEQGGQFVYVVDKNNKVQPRTVELGDSYNQMRLVKSGLKPGEIIATDKLQRLRPKMTIVPKMKEPQKVTVPTQKDKSAKADVPAVKPAEKPANKPAEKPAEKSKGAVDRG